MILAGWASLSENMSNYYTTTEIVEKYIKESLQDEKMIQLFAFQRQGSEESIVGTLTVERQTSIMDKPLPPNDGMLGRFSIRPDLQSKGLGRMIMEAGLEAMKQAGYTVCSILVFENRENVLRWYEKLGFKYTQERYPFVPPTNATLLSDHQFVLMKRDL